MKRIAYILPTLSSGGAELRAIERLNYLSKKYPVQIELIILSKKIDLIEKLNKNERLNVNVLGLNNTESFSKKAFFSSFNNSRTILKVLNNFRPDIVIASLPISHHITRIALWKSKLKPKLFIYHHATQYIANPIDSFSKRLLYQLTLYFNKRIDFGHIFISKAVKRDISRKLDIKNSLVLYNAIPDKYNSAISLKSNLNFKNFNVVIPGRLTKVKGHVPAINSIIKFLNERKDVKLWIIGEGKERIEIEKLIKYHKLQNQIYLKGEMEHELLLRYIYDCNVVLIPSLSEGLGNVAIEALMMGTTCLSSNAGGLKEIINDEELGYLFDKNNFNKIPLYLSKIYENEKLFNKNKLRNSYLKRFTIENHIDKLYSFLIK